MSWGAYQDLPVATTAAPTASPSTTRSAHAPTLTTISASLAPAGPALRATPQIPVQIRERSQLTRRRSQVDLVISQQTPGHLIGQEPPPP
jgi:hypothetical protein